MRLRVIALIAMCLMCHFSTQAQTLKTSESSIVLNKKTADAKLVFEHLNNSLKTVFSLELLDRENKVRAMISDNVKIKKGKKTYKFSLPLGDLLETDEDEIIWYRLRLKIGMKSEIVSLSELVRGNYELRVIATDQILSGMNYRSRVRAINPLNKAPVKGVRVTARLKLELKDEEKDDLIFNAAGKTDENGFAVLDFKIPTEAELDDDGELKVLGKKNGLIREATESIMNLTGDFSFLMLTDKPIYQPEQDLKVRGVLLKGAEEKTVVANEDVDFRIEDEEGTLLYKETVTTSEFGVANIAWKIPENAKLGDYKIRVKSAGRDYFGYQKVKVSRYDLPNFVVKPKLDKDFYLPEENEAEIEVRADYLFGKPVTKGKVRVVEEKSREWNWHEQKYDIDEGQVREGEVDSEGKFIAKIDLKKAHEDLSDDDYDKFRDLNFTAYFTDLTTNKTEQRRFDIRVTKESIHVYFIGEAYNINAKMPVTAYVSTFYADGSPAICEVEFKGREDDDDDKQFRTIQKIKTNSFGAGKLKFDRPKFIDEDDYMDIALIAKDKKGNKGTHGGDGDAELEFDDDEDESIQIETEKTIYKPGESIKANINSSAQKGLVYVDVVKGWSVVDSYFVSLENGRAKLKIPYQENFQGELKIAAYFEDEDEDVIRTGRGVIFPTPQNLQIEANFNKATYKPTEEAKVKFSVLDTVGNAIESALGVVVFDKAVEERAKTDADFGGMFSNFQGWLGYGESFGSISVKDLNELDLSKPISDEIQLVAEVILRDSYYYPNIFHSRNYETDAKSVYQKYFSKQFSPIEAALKETYKNKNFRHPTNGESLAKILGESSLSLENLRDPWGQKYKAVFDVVKTQNTLAIKTAGADKQFNTKDDFAVSSLSFNYIKPLGTKIDLAVKNYHERTGGFIRDEKMLLQELGLSELKDRFGRPYKIFFEVNKRHYQTRIRSLGKNGVYEKRTWRGDDFDVWTNRIDYFKKIEEKIAEVLQISKTKPLNEKEFIKVLAENGVEFGKIKDGYDQKLYLRKRQFSRYADKVEIENVSKYGEKETTQHKKITPVTQEVVEFTLRSRGKDGVKGYYDDFTIAQYLFVISEQTKDDKRPKVKIKKIVFKSGTGAIRGMVTDATGAVVPGANVIATNEETQQSRTVTTNNEGKYLISNLAVGNYEVKAQAAGFSTTVQSGIPVKANTTTDVDLSLSPAGANATVDVMAGSENIDTQESKIVSTVTSEQVATLPNGADTESLLRLKSGVARQKAMNEIIEIDGKKFVQDEFGKLVPFREKSTPRLREYFPETLLWSPEVITNKDGKAEIKFKMADNITTWKLYTIASTKTGKIGVAEKEVQAFQPFFVDLEPPKFLTEGDEIHLPTQIRNYTKSKQKVDVTMAKSDWFSFLNAETRTPGSVSDAQTKKIEVEKGKSENAVFGFKAEKFIKDGKQTVTAIAETDSDAIEKPVTVRPNGQEIVKTESKLFRQNAEFQVDFPANAIVNTPRATLKIYPNLLAHVVESVEGLLQRPYGCGEQTISSTYPNLMILKFTPKENKLRKVANKFLKKGYERLLGYQVSSGGFSYWGGNEAADIALTAYAIRFLNDAKSQIKVDENVIKRAEDWLINEQRADGSWTKKYSWERNEDRNRTKMLTSYIARTLAVAKSGNESSMRKALAYLKARNEEIDEPYALSLLGLASAENGRIENAKIVAKKLAAMAISEGNGVYWKLETNTPFYGWGKAGRIETTALVLQLLNKIGDAKYESLIGKGTQFLLKNKDRFGVWYSTQTTVNVLDAFLATLGSVKKTDVSSKRIAEVFVSGQKIRSFELPPVDVLASPINLETSSRLTPRNNRIEIKTGDNSMIMAQVVQEHYVDWQEANISNRNTNQSRQIRLDYSCDKLNIEIMEEVACDVKAERIGFRGYGMLLAEIGIPPGADVDRESLEDAFKKDWSLSRYDILPDRIIVYMWARPGGTEFSFKFKPRYGIKAQTPASVVYDYYNDEARALVAPLRFEVK